MNLFKPCFKDNSMDLVISNGVIHHTYNPELGFMSISKLVKPGGYIIISLYNYLGRIITLINKFFYKIFGDKGLIFDKYLKTNLSKEKISMSFRMSKDFKNRINNKGIINWKKIFLLP